MKSRLSESVVAETFRFQDEDDKARAVVHAR